MNPLGDLCLPQRVGSLGEEGALRLYQEGQAVYELAKSPGWDRIRAIFDEKLAVTIQDRVGADAAALSVMQRQKRGANALLRRLQERIKLWEKAADRLKAIKAERATEGAEPERQPYDLLPIFMPAMATPTRPVWTEIQAREAIKEADEIEAAIQLEGWGVLIGDMVGEVWTRYLSLEDCEPAEAPANQWAVAVLEAVISQIEQKLARRDVAAAFLQEHAKARDGQGE